LNALILSAGSGTSWTITGGTLQVSVTVTWTETYSVTGEVGALNLKATDTADDAVVTLVENSSGDITGTISQLSTGDPVATFTIDADGNGTITYANGTSGTISDYVITS
jgi:hypothetical protein